MDAELVVNLWAIFDAEVGLVYGLLGRAYNMCGSEDDKLKLLQHLSTTDYVTAKRYELPDRFQVRYADGTVQQKVATVGAVADPNAHLFEEMFKNIEAELPPLPDFSTPQGESIPQTLPMRPVCVITVLYEDESGNIRPVITDEDRKWVAEQERERGRIWEDATEETPEFGDEPFTEEDVKEAEADLGQRPPQQFDFTRLVQVYQSLTLSNLALKVAM